MNHYRKMKAIIIGPSLSGKTTLVRYLRKNTSWPISEMDEELTRLNGGTYPTDPEYKHSTLAPRVIADILSRREIIFSTNTDYYSPKDLAQARLNGFKIIQLSLPLSKLQKRNQTRVKNEGYADLAEYLPGMIAYQKDILQKGLVDKILNGEKPIRLISQELQYYLEK